MAERVATGERLSVMAAPRWPLSPSTSFHTGLTEATLLGAGDGAALVAGAQAFLRPDDVLCAWGHHSANLLAKAGATLPRERLDLRAALQRLRNAKLGTLDDVGESLAAEASPALGSETAGAAPAGPGRAGRRLAILTALVRAWYRQEQG
jgi:hypothetical protein